ncbi:hypothetical protein CAPTEDRAFT_192426 [Capitella teleta]|uniref:Glutaredoxin domain-containing protein n=1 Tax=Capitella teleta TaxID=283909 RepID=R7VCN7_CAPTE|nr:hypothetical protein CAPTEDRAFT_192426 [Capitella teleta]|eukprot:ELU16317.1 hypothetical protein CAPTEDRAFT_192426 [Capitella teleta]
MMTISQREPSNRRRFLPIKVKQQVKDEQKRAMFILESKKIPFETVDVAKSKAKVRIMKATVGDANANPPRFFKGEVYLGGFKEFIEAVDEGRMQQWLRLTTDEAPPPKEYTLTKFSLSHYHFFVYREKKDVLQNPVRYDHLKRRLDSAIKEVDSMKTKS